MVYDTHEDLYKHEHKQLGLTLEQSKKISCKVEDMWLCIYRPRELFDYVQEVKNNE